MSAPVVHLPTRGEATVVALCGGVGGAKLAHGLYEVLPPGTLTVVTNTGDDFQHLGLHISPISTLCSTHWVAAPTRSAAGRAGENMEFYVGAR